MAVTLGRDNTHARKLSQSGAAPARSENACARGQAELPLQRDAQPLTYADYQRAWRPYSQITGYTPPF